MNEYEESSLAAYSASARSVVGIVLLAMLAACGQKGPLFLPAQAGAAARSDARPPGTQDDAVPRAPPPPLLSASSPGVPSGVVSDK